MRADIPRPEYPRPQFRRDEWLCLNGVWQFEFDPADSGFERGLGERDLAATIVVPFCPESELSGLGDLDFHPAVWYRRTVTIPGSWAGLRIILHFGAVDHDTTVWVDGVEAGRHRGGFTPFSCDLGPRNGEIEILVRARDPKDTPQARGKQSQRYKPYGCFYPRTTGIWQTVWCEPVADVCLGRPRITPDLAAGAFHLGVPVTANRPGQGVRAVLTDEQGVVVSEEVRADLDMTAQMTLAVPAGRLRLWSPADPYLYGLSIELVDADGLVVDRAESYAGLRSVAIDGRKVLINGQPVFQRLVLDQGYFPDGMMTAPDDAALRRDIDLALAAGFNGARLHQKVFEERFLYHADRAGYLVWGEFGDWGSGVTGGPGAERLSAASMVAQWLEAVERDYSHPCIVGWCPLNETRQEFGESLTVLDDVTRAMFLATKAADRSRPVLDASGYSHRIREADIYDSHNYGQDPRKFAEAMAGLADDRPFVNEGRDGARWSVDYSGQPYFCSEFGGIWWAPGAADESWGYGSRPASAEEYVARFEGLTSALLANPEMFGYCYTQLTDTYQERNGIYRFDRTAKIAPERLRAIQQRPAAFESAPAEPKAVLSGGGHA
ncbi:MAG TPA: beta-galactosidase [Streptosporangiaceae bacterium]|nr:beta-galactosidase [Streptosporangiaceae bacterium]